MSNLSTSIQAESFAQGIYTLTKAQPTVIHREKKSEISFTPQEATKVRTYINDILHPKKTGNIDWKVNNVVFPVLIREVGPYLLGALAIGYLLGRKL